MKRIIVGLLVLTSFMFAACSKDAEVGSFISDSDKLANDIVQKVKATPTAAGIDEAQKTLDGKKADIKAKYESLKNVRGFQVKSETMKQLTDSVTKNITAVNSLKIDLMTATMNDKALSDKLDKLIDEYNALYKS